MMSITLIILVNIVMVAGIVAIMARFFDKELKSLDITMLELLSVLAARENMIDDLQTKVGVLEVELEKAMRNEYRNKDGEYTKAPAKKKAAKKKAK